MITTLPEADADRVVHAVLDALHSTSLSRAHQVEKMAAALARCGLTLNRVEAPPAVIPGYTVASLELTIQPAAPQDKHTPAPWTVFDVGECPGIEAYGVSIVVYGAKFDEDENCGVQGYTPEEARANAFLMAAAPEMLEALEYVTERILAQHVLNEFEEAGLAKARAAIAKAREAKA